MMEHHDPIKLKFYSMSIYGFSNNTKCTFQSNKGHEISTQLTEQEKDTIRLITEACKIRAMKEIPEMIAEVIAEERVTQILAKRELESLEMKPKQQPEEEIVF